MRLRRFTGKHPREALAQVKATLGPEAVILATRPLPGGGVEITAAVDLDEVVAPAAASVAAPASATVGPDAVARELETLAARLTRLDSTLASRLDRALAGQRRDRPGTAAAERDGLDDEARALAERLALHGTPFALADATARSFARARRKGETAAAALAASVTKHLVSAEPAPVARVTAFVGPTGSGKTTTIAKLAAQALTRGSSVGLVMADTHRIAAAEQLGTYARLLDVPMRTVRDRDELAAALTAFGDRDAVYVDTAGLTGDGGVADEVAALWGGAGEAVATIAVVPANASEAAWRRFWRQLDRLDPVASVVTKVDEQSGLGAACAWLTDVGVPLAWLGTGTRVPDDLVPADASAVAAWLTAA